MKPQSTQKFSHSGSVSQTQTSSKFSISRSLKKKLLATCAMIFFVSTIIALYQPPITDPFLSPTGFNKFIYPRENNPLLRLPRIASDISDVAIVADDIWLVGTGGLILHSDNAGECWEAQGSWIINQHGEGADAISSNSDSKRNTNSDEQSSRICPENQTGIDRVFDGLATVDKFSGKLSFFSRLNAKEPEKKTKAKRPVSKISDNKSRSKSPSSPLEEIVVTGRGKGQYVNPSKSSSSASEKVKSVDIPNDYFPRFNAVAFSDPLNGVIVGDSGVILRTQDGGKVWQNVGAFGGQDLNSITFVNATSKNNSQKKWIAVGNRGSILLGDSNANIWQYRASNVKSDLNDLFDVDDQTLVIVGNNSTALVYDINRKRTEKIDLFSRGNLLSVSGNSKGEVLVSGQAGSLFYSNSAKLAFSKLSTQHQQTIEASILNQEGGAIAVTKRGNIFSASVNDLNSWRNVYSSDNGQFNALASSVGSFIIAGGVNGLLLKSNDQGKSWRALANPNVVTHNVHYSVGLAYWWYLVTMLCIGFAIRLIWPVQATGIDNDGIAGIAASDRPLEPGDPEAKNLDGLANDITLFLSNPKTTAPLTLAITGPWGCGKSSLMNLVKAKLEERQFSPVWFNAWHHQKGEQLLASLFAHIKQQAIPSWFSLDGIWFRLKLAAIRGRRHWFIVTLMLFLLFSVWAINQHSIKEFTRLLVIAAADPDKFWLVPWQKLNPLGLFTTPTDWVEGIGSLLGVAAPILALMKAVRGFGISPEKLVSIDHRNTANKGYDPGARSRFATEFNDVTKALGDNKMVIFIDDLDRCTQDNLIDILENINFISNSGDCFLVLGMAPKYIKACVANAYETLAKSIAEKENYESNGVSSGINTERHKFNFANQYLEKMINIEVVVPCMKEKGAIQLLQQQDEQDGSLQKDEKWSVINSVYRWLSIKSGQLIQSILFILAIGYGWQYGNNIPDRPPLNSAKSYDLGTLNKYSILKLFADSENGINGHELVKKLQGLVANESGQFGLSLQVYPNREQSEFKLATIGDESKNISLVLRVLPKNSEARLEGASVDVQESYADKIDLGADPLNPQRASGIADQVASERATVFDSLPSKIVKQATNKAATFRAAENEKEGRLSAIGLLLGLLIFSLVALFINKRKRQKYSRDSDDFKQSLLIWMQWILINQQTPRAIKRFLNHLRFQSIRNRKKLRESVLVAAASIFCYNKNWLLNDESFTLLANGNLVELLRKELENTVGHNIASKELSNLAAKMQQSLNNSDIQLLAKNRTAAIDVLGALES